MNPLNEESISAFTNYDLSLFPDASSLLNSMVVPRPIAFITTQGENGIVNAAPYSYFNIVTTTPPLISVSIKRKQEGQYKDTARNIFFSKELVVNICSVEMAKAVSIAAGEFPPDCSEIELAHLSLLPSIKVKVPRIAQTSIQLECRLLRSLFLEQGSVDFLIAEVVMLHVEDRLFNTERQIDFETLNPLARMGRQTFGKVGHYFDLPRGLP